MRIVRRFFAVIDVEKSYGQKAAQRTVAARRDQMFCACCAEATDSTSVSALA
jgi:hypothetical protein